MTDRVAPDATLRMQVEHWRLKAEKLAEELHDARAVLEQARHWLDDAIDSEGCTDDELLEREGMFWARLLSVRGVLRETDSPACSCSWLRDPECDVHGNQARRARGGRQ